MGVFFVQKTSIYGWIFGEGVGRGVYLSREQCLKVQALSHFRKRYVSGVFLAYI